MTRDRVGILVLITLAAFGMLWARTFQVQVVEANVYEGKAENQSLRRVIWRPQRGSITDRHDRILAVDQSSSQRLTQPIKRNYPQGRLASQVLGFIGNEGKGLQGLEYYFEERLRGIEGWSYLTVDSRQRPLPGLDRKGMVPTPGFAVALTIDNDIQEIVENALQKGVKKLEADRASAIVVDPNTGEILAMAAYPNFDPNFPRQVKGNEVRNDAISLVYEPGSTFKLITACAALEEQSIDPMKLIDGEGGRLVLSNGEVIRDGKDYGQMNMYDAMAVSSNVAFAKIASTVGNEKFYRFVRSFGFGSPTSIDLPGEESGRLKLPHQWSGRTLITMAMGHEILVTPLQMAMAYSAVANGGELLMPRIIKEWRNQITGEVLETPEKRVIRRVVSQETAAMARSMMREVVIRGTGRNIRSQNLDFAGKTGTAEKFNVIENRYDRNSMISSFIGMVPANNPRYVAVVLVDEPRTYTSGAYTAGPIFKEVLERIYAHPQASPLQYNLAHIAGIDSCLIFNYIGLTQKNARDSADLRGCKLKFAGSGTQVVSQQVLNQSSGEIKLTLGVPIYKSMPDLLGLPLRDAMEVLGGAKAYVKVSGKGWVAKQEPKPHENLNKNQMIHLTLREAS